MKTNGVFKSLRKYGLLLLLCQQVTAYADSDVAVFADLGYGQHKFDAEVTFKDVPVGNNIEFATWSSTTKLALTDFKFTSKFGSRKTLDLRVGAQGYVDDVWFSGFLGYGFRMGSISPTYTTSGTATGDSAFFNTAKDGLGDTALKDQKYKVGGVFFGSLGGGYRFECGDGFFIVPKLSFEFTSYGKIKNKVATKAVMPFGVKSSFGVVPGVRFSFNASDVISANLDVDYPFAMTKVRNIDKKTNAHGPKVGLGLSYHVDDELDIFGGFSFERTKGKKKNTKTIDLAKAFVPATDKNPELTVTEYTAKRTRWQFSLGCAYKF